MRSGTSRLDRTIEVVLTTGVAASGALLLLGLTLGRSGLLRAGIWILMLTPVARLVVLSVGLIHARDWLFAVVSLWVLLVVASGLAVAVRVERPVGVPASHRSP